MSDDEKIPGEDDDIDLYGNLKSLSQANPKSKSGTR